MSALQITTRHLTVLAMMEEEPFVQPDEVSRRLRVPLLEIEGICRDLAAAGMFGEGMPPPSSALRGR